jgi:aminoglycoside phosphotransferase (APT) family kinase protein
VTSVADTALPLAALTAPDGMTSVLRTALGSDAGVVTAVEVLDHKPGRRVLLSYETTGLGAIYGKAFPDAAPAGRTHDLMTRVAEAMGRADGLTAPRPLALVSELALVLYDPLRGPALDALVGTDAMLPALAAAGRWLSALHAADIALDRVLDLEHEAANASAWGGRVARIFPELAPGAARLTALVAGTIPTPTAEAVPIHKDFHYQHVIVGESLGVVDIDEARLGDRLFDVGHFLANLELLAQRSGAPDAELERWRAAFAESCGMVRDDDARVQWYVAYTFVKLAKQLATGQGPHLRPSGDARLAQAAWALERGLTLVGA